VRGPHTLDTLFGMTQLRTAVLAPIVLAGWIHAQAAADPLEGIGEYTAKAMQDWRVPGVAIAVVKDDKIVFAKGFGVREMGGTDKVDENTLFAIASNSKAFTCALLGMLEDEGKLDWNDKVCEILPWFHLNEDYATRDLRVIDLVVHRSGLPTFGGDHLWIGSKKKTREILERIRYQKLSAPFRSTFQYQNIMYTAAGEVIRAKSGKSWSEFVKARILDPLGMKRTRTSVKDLGGMDNVATPHEIRGGELVKMEYDNVDGVPAAAALNSSVVDVAQWLRMNLAYGKFGGKQLISAAVIDHMVQAHNTMPASRGYARFFGQHFRAYGLGWFLNDYKGRKIISHGGGLTGMISKTTWVPEERLGIVILTNMAENSISTAVTNRILDRYFGEKDRDWNRDFLGFRDRGAQRRAQAERRLVASRVENTKPSLPLARYVGTYHNPLPGDATVTMKDGKLYFFYNRRHRGYLTHWHYDTFRIVWINNIMDMSEKAFVRFAMTENGKVYKLHTTWYHKITFERK
jgi:CubicO group peptidase (beta-lactamase class C family)